MALQLEMNVVMFPQEKPYECKDSDAKIEFTSDKQKELYQANGEIHMIKLGPITEEFLTRKKIGWSRVDLGIDFKLTDDGDYKWDSGEETKGMPIFHFYSLLDALKSIGYESERSFWYYKCGSHHPVDKYFVQLVKKF